MPRLKIGVLVDRYDLAKLDVEKADAELSKAKKELDKISNMLEDRFTNQELDGASGSNGGAQVSRVKHTNPTIVDRKKLDAYIRKHGANDLMQARINKQSWLDRMDADGKPIPGVKTFEKFTLKLTRKK